VVDECARGLSVGRAVSAGWVCGDCGVGLGGGGRGQGREGSGCADPRKSQYIRSCRSSRRSYKRRATPFQLVPRTSTRPHTNTHINTSARARADIYSRELFSPRPHRLYARVERTDFIVIAGARRSELCASVVATRPEAADRIFSLASIFPHPLTPSSAPLLIPSFFIPGKFIYQCRPVLCPLGPLIG
jgi:hypothetical protein